MNKEQLNRVQMVILNRWGIYNHWDELPGDVRIKLKTSNDYDNLWLHASRYLGDLK
jgi:hypothetical protein